MTLKVINGGLHTTIQDHGRIGLSQLGFASSGMLDIDSYLIANWLVGNHGEEAALEMIGIGGEFLFTEPTQFSLTGADCSPTLNKKPIDLYKNYQVKAGDKLQCGSLRDGMITVMAIYGGFRVDKVMDSASTHTKIQIGGFQGRTLQPGDQIPYSPTDEHHFLHRSLKKEKVYPQRKMIRVTRGPQSSLFTEDTIQQFTKNNYTLSSKFDRMGYRFEGEGLYQRINNDMISEGTVLGGIQVPSDGQPIVLLNDRQTAGGYPVIAVVTSVDLPSLVQQKSGSTVHFQWVSLEEAQQALKEKKERMNHLKEGIKNSEQWQEPLKEEKIGKLIRAFEGSSLKQFYYTDDKTRLKLVKGDNNSDYNR